MRYILGLTVIIACFLYAGCGKKGEASADKGTGTIVFTANGEDFVRKGFVDKQGWSISFDRLFVNIADPVAYGEPGEVSLNGMLWTDLAQGDEHAPVVEVGKAENINPGNYQSLRFSIKRADTGEYKGYSIVMIGTAEKNGDKIPFVIKLDEEMDFNGKEGYVGDEIKGMLASEKQSEVEMTFHFDHLFGDNEADADDHINTGSIGFDFFNQFAKEGKVDVSQNEMKDKKEYPVLIKALWTLGHCGEGHCECTNQSSRSLIKDVK